MVQKSGESQQDEADDWLHMAEVFLDGKQADDAAECIARTRKLSPLSSRLSVTEGLLKQVGH